MILRDNKKIDRSQNSTKLYIIYYMNIYGDSDVFSFYIYASWFSPPSYGQNAEKLGNIRY